jgi:DNA (cytosine-5)-methyltransferase 1
MRARGVETLNLVPEYERVVAEAAPQWFVMENVPEAPEPRVRGYHVSSAVFGNRDVGGVQDRVRRFSLGSFDRLRLDTWIAREAMSARIQGEYAATVTAAHAGARGTAENPTPTYRIAHYSVEEALRLQGCPPDFFGPRSPFRRDAQLKMLAEGVPLPMGRAVARAVRSALGLPLLEDTPLLPSTPAFPSSVKDLPAKEGDI